MAKNWTLQDLVKKGLMQSEHLPKSLIVTPESITIDIRAVPKPRMTQSDKWKQRPIVTNYRQYKDDLRSLLPQGFFLPDSFKIIFAFEITESWSKDKKLSMLSMPHQQKPDLDNCVKGITDALNKKDESIWHCDAKKIWALKNYIQIIIAK